MKVGLPLINVLIPSTKSVLIPLGSTALASATDTAIQKKICGLGHPLYLAKWTIPLIISKAEMENTMKIVKALKTLV